MSRWKEQDAPQLGHFRRVVVGIRKILRPVAWVLQAGGEVRGGAGSDAGVEKRDGSGTGRFLITHN